jgi:hypothetical protein
MTGQTRKSFLFWIAQEILNLPKQVTLLYFEYQVSGKHISCALFGYKFPEKVKFDPENSDHLNFLSRWDWENTPNQPFTFRSKDSDTVTNAEAVRSFFQRSLSESEIINDLICHQGLEIIYGEHEGSPEFLAKPKQKLVNDISHCGVYFQLCFETFGSHFIEAYEIDETDEEHLLNGEKITSDICQIKLILQKKARVKDLLYFYRRWLVCSQRLASLFQNFTENIQTFPAHVECQDGKEVEGYQVINLYEKIDCIGAEWLVKNRDGLLIKSGTNYQIIDQAVRGKDIFRANVYPYPVLVSQRLRNEIENQKITGITWLKRTVTGKN